MLLHQVELMGECFVGCHNLYYDNSPMIPNRSCQHDLFIKCNVLFLVFCQVLVVPRWQPNPKSTGNQATLFPGTFSWFLPHPRDQGKGPGKVLPVLPI